MGNYAKRLASFTRPADTTTYTIGDLLANSVTAGSVVPLTFTFPELNRERDGKVRKARIQKSTATTTLATFRLHLFSAIPTVTNGDNGALLVTVANMNSYIGAIDVDMATAPTVIATANPSKDSADVALNFSAAGGSIYGLLEVVAAYVPASAEVFTVALAVDFT